MKIVNIAAYRFVDLDDVEQLQERIEQVCQQGQCRGTVLLAKEGINIMLAGPRSGIDKVIAFFQADDRFAGIDFKQSISDFVPFQRLKVRIKDEVIAMRQEGVRPLAGTANHLSADTLKQWLDQEKPLTILDTRNRFEIERGTFDNAVDVDIESFRQFPQALNKLPESLKQETVVIVCTGGIRCEKAAIAMFEQGYQDVHQLDGGILKYFEQCGGAHWHGDCVVFDDRIAVDSQLQAIKET